MGGCNIKVSIIIPVYNTEKYLVKCLESVCNQTFRDIEIICINDSSTNDSIKILNKYKENDSRIKIITNKINQGLSYSRNVGLKEAIGEFVWFIDSDDSIAERDAVEKIYAIVNNNNLDIVSFDFEYEYENIKLKDLYPSYNRPNSNCFSEILIGREMFERQIINGGFYTPACSYVFKRSYLIDNNLFFKDIIHEDDLFSPLAMIKADKVGYIEGKYYRYYRRDSSLSTSNNIPSHLQSYIYIYDELLTFLKEEGNLGKCEYAYIRYLMSIKSIIFRYYIEWVKNGGEIKFSKDYYNSLLQIILEEKYPYISTIFNNTIFNAIKNNKSLIIYGAGEVSLSVQALLYDLGIKEYIIAISNGNDKYPSIDSINIDKKECVVLIAALGNKKYEMSENLTKQGFSNYFYMT